MSGEEDGAARPTASGSLFTKLSEFYPYGDEPPRLAAGLNDTPTDASDTAEFFKVGKEKPQPPVKKGTPKPPPEKATEVDLPRRDVVPSESLLSAETITRVTDWVKKRLDGGLGSAWLSQLHSYEQWVRPDQAAEGLWASQFTEIFLGVTYAGPAIVYDLGNPLTRDADGKIVHDVDAATRQGRNTGKVKKNDMAKGVPATAWEPWMFRRIERKRRQYKAEPLDVVTWEDLTAKFTEDAVVDNTDPAVPVTCACQHMTTFMVLSRGFTIGTMGDGTNGPTGLAASDVCFSFPLFCKERVEVAGKEGAAAGGEAGKAPAAGADAAKAPAGGASGGAAGAAAKAPPKPPPGPPQTSYVDAVSGESIVPLVGGKHVMPDDAILEVKKARELGLGPGTIVIYDPDRGADTKATLWMNSYERHLYGDDVAIWGKYLKTRNTNKAKNVQFKSSVDWSNAGRANQYEADLAAATKAVTDLEAKTNRTKSEESSLEKARTKKTEIEGLKSLDDKRTAVPFPGNRQYDGAHIYGILRVHPDKDYVQFFDVNPGENTLGLASTQSDTLILRQSGAGIIDGGRKQSSIYDPKKAFAGYGILPPHTVDMEHVEHLKRVRPVGLARLALTVRPVDAKGKARQMTSNDVLFVSTMFRMYGDEPTQNHYISHLLWSLRNTPGFTTVQPWFFIYAPRGLLARCMYAHGARKMTIGQFLAKHRPESQGWLTPNDLLMQVVVSNESEEARAGLCSLFCRYKSAPNGKTTKTFFDPTPPPPPLMALVDEQKLNLYDRKKRSLNWDQFHVHPKITLDPSTLPPIFGVGG